MVGKIVGGIVAVVLAWTVIFNLGVAAGIFEPDNANTPATVTVWDTDSSRWVTGYFDGTKGSEVCVVWGGGYSTCGLLPENLP